MERVRRRRAAAAQWHGRRRAVLRAVPLRYPALWVAAAAVKQEVVYNGLTAVVFLLESAGTYIEWVDIVYYDFLCSVNTWIC